MSGATPPSRAVGRRAGLPNGRAVAGAFLVVVAVVGVVASYRRAEPDAGQAVLVASRDVLRGTVLDADDLAWVELDLPDDLDRRVFATPDELVGKQAIASMARGDLIQASSVVAAEQGGPSFQLSVAIPRARALDGRIDIGIDIELAATYTDGASPRTVVVAPAATVVDVRGGEGGGFGASDDLVLTVEVDDGAESLAIVHAGQVGVLTVVRAFGRR